MPNISENNYDKDITPISQENKHIEFVKITLLISKKHFNGLKEYKNAV